MSNVTIKADDAVVIPARDVAEYLRLRAAGYVTLWSGEGKVCLRPPAKEGQ